MSQATPLPAPAAADPAPVPGLDPAPVAVPQAQAGLAGARGAGANAVPAAPEPDDATVFSLVAATPAVLAETSAAPIPPAWTPLTPALLLGQAVALAGSVPAPVPSASALLATTPAPSFATFDPAPANAMHYLLPAA